MSAWSKQVHMLDGFTPAGDRVRASCTCGFRTTPRVDQRRAEDGLLGEHGFTDPVCALCGRSYTGLRPLEQRRRLDILADGLAGEFPACRDMPQECRDGAAQRQVQLDRTAAEAWNLPELARPRLRVVGGTEHRPGTAS